MNELAARTINPLGEAKLIRFRAVQERVGMGRTAVYELIKAGKFPRPVKVGAASAWIDAEITRWIEELAARRDAPDGHNRRRMHLLPT
jgi:prophage regulatory protein